MLWIALPNATAQRPATPVNQAGTPESKSSQEALVIFADAASFQNNTAYDLAIAEWKKLIQAHPSDPVISKAHHYLGICYLQKEKPDFASAAEALRVALRDSKLEVREETLVNLGWSLYSIGKDQDPAIRNKTIEEAITVFRQFLKEYADGSFADKAVFYAGECEYLLGHTKEATEYYRQFQVSRTLAKSPIRPDAMYALGVNYEELKQDTLASDVYDNFLKEFANHRLNPEVRMRKADILIRRDKMSEAASLLKPIADRKVGSMQDYALYRYGYALAKLGKFEESAAVYKRLTDQFPDSPYAVGSFLAAGQTLMRDKKYDEAAKYFNRLLDAKNVQAAEAAHWLCQIYILQRKFPTVVPIARQALEWASDTPFFVPLQMDLADALLEQPSTKAEARSLFEQIATNHAEDPIAPRATYNAAFAALQSGDPTEAKRWSTLFAKRYPKDPLAPDVDYVAAESTLQLGQHLPAAEAFEKLIRSQIDNPMRPSWQVRLGTARFLGGKYDEAIAQLKADLPRFKEVELQAEAHYLLGACLLQKEKFDEAVSELSKSLKLAPKWFQSDEVHLLLSQAYTKAGKVDDAKKILEKLISEFPNSRFKTQAEYRLGQLSASRAEFDKAIVHYDNVLKDGKEVAFKDYASYGKAWALIQKQQYSAAMTLLEPLIDPKRTDAVANEARLAQAICLRQSGKIDASVTALQQIVAADPNSPSLGNALYELGLAHAELKQYEQAAEALNRVRRVAPKFSSMDKVLYELAWAYKQQKKDDLASEAFKSLVDQFSDSSLAAEANYHIGQNEYAREKYDRAVPYYISAINRSSDQALQEKSLHKLGWSYFQQRNFEKAAEQFARQVKQHPRGPLYVDAVFMQGECSLKAEKYEEAWSRYKEARKALEALSDRSSIAQDVQTLIYLHGAQASRELKPKQWNETEKWLRVIVDKDAATPYLPHAIYELAYCSQNQNKIEEALRLYGEVANKYRNEISARSRFMMGEIHFAERDFAKAIDEFQEVMYRYGGTNAPDDIKNWQAKSAIEAGRCSEVLISELRDESRRSAAVESARKFYKFVIENHGKHVLADQAKSRIAELDKL